MFGAQDALVGRLSASGWQVTPVLAERLHTYDAPASIDANRSAVGDVVLVSLGTNDGETPAQFARWIDDVMERLRLVRRVYWVNLRPFADWVPAANAEIAAARDRWRNLRLIDWEAHAGGDPTLVYADGIHLTGAGQAAMAELVGETLDAYAEEVTVSTTSPAPVPEPTTPPTTPLTAPPPTSASSLAAGRGTVDEGVPVGVVLALVAATFTGIGLVAFGWARRPRGRHSPQRGPRRLVTRRRGR